MQWQIEDAMLHGLEIVDGLAAKEQFERDSVADAVRRVQEALPSQQGRR